MKRLFITTGLISLINACTIIKDDYRICDDVLIILSFSQSADFIENTKKIAQIHNFSKILFFKKEKEIKKNINFKNYDEIYTTTISKLYKHFSSNPNWFLFDEGPGGGICDVRKQKNLKGIYFTKFINKFDIITRKEKTLDLDIKKQTFLKISDDIINIFQLPKTLKTKKNMLFIGHYIYRKLGNEFVINYYKKYINYFISLNYNVYFKAHPRDEEELEETLGDYYKNNPLFHFFKSTLPIEIYNYDFDFIAGSYSGTLISMPHYRNIPSINLDMKELYLTDLGINFKKFFALYDFYTPSFDEMKDFLGLDKDKIFKRYQDIIAQKPELKNNEKLKKIILYRPNKIKDILFSFFSYFFFFNKNIRLKVKSYARNDFNKIILREN